jgi:prolyl-tRNA synthetase
MKDMYSLARNQDEHTKLYEKAAQAYTKVYKRLGIGDITYRTYADGGIFTDKFSDEYQTISPIGEDIIYVNESKKIAVNKEILTDKNLTKLGLKREELVEKRGVEVGNIFPLETKYTDALDVYYSDENGKQHSIIMGCYGIGISRLMGVLVEHFSDDKGLVWPENIAPAKIIICQIGADAEVVKEAENLYEILQKQGISVLYDDRDIRPGQKFADADLIGIPNRVVISGKTVKEQKLEYKKRVSDSSELISQEQLLKMLAS